MTQVTCARCGQTRDAMAFQPFQNDLGKRVFQEICGACWGEWLMTQRQLINHYGLNVRETEAKEFLLRNMQEFLFSGRQGVTATQEPGP